MPGRKTRPREAKPKLTEKVLLRLSTWEKNRLQGLADTFAGGNLSLWLVYGGLHVTRKHLEEEDLWESSRRIRRKK